MTISVVLDSCVIFPMPLCDTLLRAAEAELYRIHFSQEILDGATRNLVKKGRMTEVKEARFQQMLKNCFPEAIAQVPSGLIEAMTNHPGDRHVVATAVIAQASVIVTFNLKHFQKKDLEPFGIEAWHPDRFLTYLDELFPDKLLGVIKQQSNDLKNPPLSVLQLLDKLQQSNQISEFVNRIRSRID